MSLVLREHGAWAQLGLPLATALALGGLTAAGALMVAGALALFLAHEPLLVWRGARGARRRREDGPRARRRTVVLAAVGALLGAIGLWLSPPVARAVALLPAVGVGAGLAVVLRAPRLEHTLGFQLLCAATFAAAGLPVAACGAPLRPALWMTGTWVALLCASAVAVAAVKARRRAPNLRPAPAVLAAIGLVVLCALALSQGGSGTAAGTALAPGVGTTSWLALGGVGPARIRRVGWVLAAALTLSATLLAATLAP